MSRLQTLDIRAIAIGDLDPIDRKPTLVEDYGAAGSGRGEDIGALAH